jgi:hypothetical protein
MDPFGYNIGDLCPDSSDSYHVEDRGAEGR